MNRLTNLVWYIGNKAVSAPFYLAGIGAAKELNRGHTSALKGAYQLPYDFMHGVVTDAGAWSFAKGFGKTVLGVSQSAIDSPLETIVLLGAGLALGKGISLYSERKRQYKRDEGIFKARHGIK